jgi:phosphoribosylanthranilate isomerase
MSKIKICGLTKQKDIESVNLYLPDYIGFVFAEQSKRQVKDKTARELKAKLNPAVKAVGVFVNDDLERIIRLCREHTIDLIQLHGEEEQDYITYLKRHVRNPVIKAVRVRDSRDILQAAALSCEYLLFDTYQENKYGGSGKIFDWSLVFDMKKPYFLAGGIHSDNVIQAVRCNPYCIDVSSGVETDGGKDPTKIKDIIEKIRNND